MWYDNVDKKDRKEPIKYVSKDFILKVFTSNIIRFILAVVISLILSFMFAIVFGGGFIYFFLLVFCVVILYFVYGFLKKRYDYML